MMELRYKMLIGLVVLSACCQHTISVPAPECYNNTTCPCCINTSCPTDGSGQCGGNCIDGYHGGKCYNRCPGNCIRCVDAQQAVGVGVSNCTLCKDGFYFNAALYQCQSACSSNCKTCVSNASNCTSCQEGYFLTDSYQCAKCGNFCAACSSTNCSSCMVGYYLNKGMCERCDILCISCQTAQTCTCHIGCEDQPSNTAPLCSSDGLCKFGCKTNFSSSVDNRCDKCAEEFYGIHCDQKCSEHCQSTCDRLTGICSPCISSYYGDMCNMTCPNHCKSSCNQSTAQCDSCQPGFYGRDCSLNCITNCAKCLQTNGTCSTCQDGFYGASCEVNCSQNCLPQTCNMTTGYCNDGCITGYMGPMCDIPKPTTRANEKEHVKPADSQNVVAPAVGGSVTAGLLLVIVVAFGVVLFRRRSVSSFKGNFNIINLEEYNLIKTEEDDGFDPIYFMGKVDDKKKPCGKLPVKDLARFVDTQGDDFYQEDFLKLPRGLIKPCEDAKIEKNIIKNRYNGVYPYDEHRVKLLPPGSDFINACYIDGFRTKKEYIASLGPTRKAMEGFDSFWRMVWQEKTDIIVMVTNLMEGQCEQYWPDEGQSCRFGDITVTSHSTDFFSEFVVRKMTVSMDKEHRTLHHLHYTAWPDKRVPDDVSSLLEFRQKVKTTESSLGGPMIVHCSAGIGRTGTYIALDILIHQGKAEKSLDIFEWVTRMRDQRTSMVQTWQQYEFLHRALVHALTYHCEPIKHSKFHRYIASLTDKHLKALSKQMTKLEKPAEGEEEARNINTGNEGLNREGADIPVHW